MTWDDDKTVSQGPAKRRGLIVGLLLGAVVIASAPFVQTSFAARPHAKPSINIGVKNFAEEQITADMYQLLLQHHGFRVTLHPIAETPQLQSAMLRGDIDLYPEYTGTGLLVINHTKIETKAIRAYDIVKTQYRKRFDIIWLEQAPMNDTNDVAVTQKTSSKYGLHNLSDLAKVASKLTFAADPACRSRLDCLAGMQKAYGINFKSVTAISSTPVRYKGLVAGTFDAVEVFTTDAPIKADNLVVLKDNKGAVFPADHIAPIVRGKILRTYPRIRTILNPLAPYLTTQAMIKLNGKVILQSKDPLAVARSFLRSKHLM
jgi:osmoprotectant transport system substrate-binding protein